MDGTLEKVTAEVNSLQLAGDLEFNRGNLLEAYEYYRQAYDKRMLFYTRMNAENSKIYKRLAKVLYYIEDNPCEYKFPNLIEARLCAKRYIKIKKSQGKKPKYYIEFCLIFAEYYDKVLNCKEKSRLIYIKYKKKLEKVLDSDHPDLATIYNNLAILYNDLNEKEKAIELYEKCKII
ncbi:hypothetical protein SteCoe_39836 [Stentor coeruleus]|uniref:Uncharacterized protein n=1 Tax=Stentor coeruleus TaxID=5963 RepID=A0A1R2AKJ2_9CILI|nr:hypothetical protein SteCoe_39836 [Stentor coeruleus]